MWPAWQTGRVSFGRASAGRPSCSARCGCSSRALWRPLALWCLAALAVGFAARSGWLGASGVFWLYGLGALFLGLEGRNLVAAGIERIGLGFADIVEGADQTEAEETFFHRLVTASPQPAPGSPQDGRSARPRHRHVPEAGG